MNTTFILILMGILFLAVLFLYIGFLIREKKRRSPGFLPVARESTLLVTTGFTFNHELTTEENLIDYLCKYAEKRDMTPSMPAEEIYSFLVRNHDSIRLSFVMETKQPLVINNVPKVFKEAVKKYKKQEN